ncbi:MAG: VanW family protein [Paenibacillaceae bacterium]|nr:VanW family protein [Paenibacillaceae bacterium]
MRRKNGERRLKRKLFQYFPFLYRARVAYLIFKRHLQDTFSTIKFAKIRTEETLPHTCKKHQSLLRRKLGSSDPILQENKITNLRLSIRHVNGIIIRPGETFSFWKLIGKTTADKGYIEGLLLSHGDVKTGVGGGLCQLANLLFWLSLHTPLTIRERHHHSFDPFPDDQRTLPFGSGASVFYNYIDLRFHNQTDQSIQFKVWLTDEHLKGSVHIEAEWPFSYHVFEKNHAFRKAEGKNYRQNEIWRSTIDKKTGNEINQERLIANYSEVRYELPDDIVLEQSV